MKPFRECAWVHTWFTQKLILSRNNTLLLLLFYCNCDFVNGNIITGFPNGPDYHMPNQQITTSIFNPTPKKTKDSKKNPRFIRDNHKPPFQFKDYMPHRKDKLTSDEVMSDCYKNNIKDKKSY